MWGTKNIGTRMINYKNKTKQKLSKLQCQKATDIAGTKSETRKKCTAVIEITVYPGGHSLKICDGYVRPHWPPFSNRLSLNDPLFIFHILLSPNDPIFKMLSHLMTPFFRNIYRWKWGSCSHWMTPIFTDKWRPRDMYPIFVWKEGFM